MTQPELDDLDRRSLDLQLAQVVEHLNDTHADTVLFLARHLAPQRWLADAELVGVDGRGVDFALRGEDGRSGRVRFDFAGEAVDVDSIRAEVFGLLAAARAGADPG